MKVFKGLFSRRGKKWLIVIGIVLGVVALGLLLNSFGAFNGIKESVQDNLMEDFRNPSNLIKYDATYKAVDGTEKGVTVKVNGDGSIKLNGTATGDIELLLNTVARPTGYVTLGNVDFGLEDEDRAYITVSDPADEYSVYRSYAHVDNSFVVEGVDQTTTAKPLTVKLVIKSGTILDDVTIYPTLNVGMTAIDYYGSK